MKLILASKSPRRRELIQYFGLPYECVSGDADESNDIRDPALAAKEVSRRKAMACLAERGLGEDEVIIGCDTTVVLGNRIIGKPRDEADAYEILSALSGRTHSVYSGVTLIYRNKGKIRTKSFYERSGVTFDCLTEEEIRRHLKEDAFLDKAGAYAIQSGFSRHIRKITGDYNNIVGFPVSRIYKELKKITES